MGQYPLSAFLFPGQGSQYVGMGKDFFENFPAAKETFEEADSILNRHLSKIIFEGPAEELTTTRNSQVAIFVLSIAILRVLKQQFPHLKPRNVAGLSLGEYSALVAGGFLSFESALPLVQFRGECMNDACEKVKGTMAAILGLETAVINEMVNELNLPHDLWVANYNAPSQVVLSGTEKGIQAGIEAAQKRGAKRALPLQVHGAFHSGLMKMAEERLAPRVYEIRVEKGFAEIVMNAPAAIIKDPDEIKENMIRQVTSPVRWVESMEILSDLDLFLEIGCGKTLTGLNRQIIAKTTLPIGKVTDLDALANLLN